MSLFRTLKMLNVHFPHFLLSALQLSHVKSGLILTRRNHVRCEP